MNKINKILVYPYPLYEMEDILKILTLAELDYSYWTDNIYKNNYDGPYKSDMRVKSVNIIEFHTIEDKILAALLLKDFESDRDYEQEKEYNV